MDCQFMDLGPDDWLIDVEMRRANFKIQNIS